MDNVAQPVNTFHRILGDLFYPTDVTSLTIYYLAWITLFVLANIVWDIRSDKTPPFHITNLRKKISVVHSAAMFASSLLIVIALLNPSVDKIARDTIVPLILAALAGMLTTLPALCPYSPDSGHDV
jgi:hypothetical protein